jgi:tetratricopeptide (TPR) repeat protein
MPSSAIRISEPNVRNPLERLVSHFCVLLLSTSIILAQDQAASIAASLHAHDYQQAAKLARAAIRQSPSDPQLWTLQGVAYAGLGNKQQALTSFRNALRLAPDHLPALQQEAQLYYESGDLAGIPVLQHILRLRPGDPMSHAMIGVLKYKHGDCPAAVPHFAKSGHLLDSQLDGLHAYATCLVRLKKPAEAAPVLERAVHLQDDPRERKVLASVQLLAHQPQSAVETLGPLLQTAAPDPQTLELAANAYEDAGDTEKAVSAIREAILGDPQSIGLYVEFANLSATHDSAQVGINVVSDGIAQQPGAAQLYLARGVLYVQTGDYAKAETDLNRAYELDPNQSLTAAAQGLLALQQNDLDRALNEVREKLKRKPNDPLLLYVQADVLTQKGAEPGTADFQLAMQSAKKAVTLRPTLAAAHAVLAKLYLDSGQNRAAAEQCRSALQLDPKDQASVYRLIQALRKSGDTAEVSELLKRLATLRRETAKEQKQRSRYKLVEGDTP